MMEEIIEKLKGISCMLEAYTVGGDGCRWQSEGMALLNDQLCDCIGKLENKMKSTPKSSMR